MKYISPYVGDDIPIHRDARRTITVVTEHDRQSPCKFTQRVTITRVYKMYIINVNGVII